MFGVIGRAQVNLIGGLFLIGKATFEVHENLEVPQHHDTGRIKARSYWTTIFQIMLLDIVFSLDSVITAVGMARHVEIMIAAIIAAVGVMMLFAGVVGNFIENHPSIKILALSFLLLIGVMLVAEGFGKHIERGYIYFAMGFSLAVELLNMRVRKAKGVAG